MKLVFTILLVTSFVGIAVFGAFAMNHDGDHSGCIAATASGIGCPKESNPDDLLILHLTTYRGFSLATLGENATNSLLLAFALLFVISLKRVPKIPTQTLQFILSRYQLDDSFSRSEKQQLTRWLALHENSPATL